MLTSENSVKPKFAETLLAEVGRMAALRLVDGHVQDVRSGMLGHDRSYLLITGELIPMTS
jgi:hypothetical protein